MYNGAGKQSTENVKLPPFHKTLLNKQWTGILPKSTISGPTEAVLAEYCIDWVNVNDPLGDVPVGDSRRGLHD